MSQLSQAGVRDIITSYELSPVKSKSYDSAIAAQPNAEADIEMGSLSATHDQPLNSIVASPSTDERTFVVKIVG